MAERCLISGKRKYRSQLDCLLKNMKRPVMARAYRCVHCGTWHVTRREPM